MLQAPVFADPWRDYELFGVPDDAVGPPAVADLDGDGDLDAITSGTYTEATFRENTGNATSPAFDGSIAPTFYGRAAIGLVDADGDDDFDAFSGGGYLGGSSGGVWFNENIGSSAVAAWAGTSINPFGLSSVGGYVVPSPVDIDGDGDFDLFAGTLAHTFFFQNTGTIESPAFAAKIQNPFQISEGSSGSCVGELTPGCWGR